MKTNTLKRLQIFFLASCLVLGSGSAMAAGNGNGHGNNGGQTLGSGSGAMVSQLPYQDLSQEEEQGLLKMREEEKLARDVYTYLFETWQDSVFSRISEAEQRHMDAVGALISKYGLIDPVEGLAPGQFNSSEMQDLYNALTQKGAESNEAALQVGATIEDLDIKDLNDLLETTDNDDIKTVYQNLVKGSRNHLRAFGSRLAALGISYTAQFLTQEEVDAIINSPRERGRVDKDGNPVSGPGMNGKGHHGHGNGGNGQGQNFVDKDGDGVCDNLQK